MTESEQAISRTGPRTGRERHTGEEDLTGDSRGYTGRIAGNTSLAGQVRGVARERQAGDRIREREAQKLLIAQIPRGQLGKSWPYLLRKEYKRFTYFWRLVDPQ